MEARIVIVAYKPKEGKFLALQQLMQEHLSILKSQNLVTDRASVIMQAEDGTLVEVFEWKSKAAMEQAHTNPVVTEMWSKYAEVCDYIPLRELDETRKLFADFTPFL